MQYLPFFIPSSGLPILVQKESSTQHTISLYTSDDSVLLPSCCILIRDCPKPVHMCLPLHGTFPGCPVIETLPSNAGSAGSIPGRGAKIPHASQLKNQNIKQKKYCNKFYKDFKNGPHQKKILKKISVFHHIPILLLN